ncbi:PAS domain S-box protein [Planomonospora sp. ID91781]|uniref:PAS domain-containing sensor histidine kinase n=1 Tax=Planomonospora sp. ID91781 TaxID=2738135 RepID=UPI0018C37257|nr:PAS domain S-box protein [Planomonospora sp. ID91781]MBG0822969.1 PAS domain S-box protein [Planomonospora sp. ID91781]
MGTVGDLGDAQALQAILERARDAFISFDAAGTVRAWNAAAERLFGWPAAEALGRSVTALIAPPSLRHRYDEGLAHLHEHGASDLPDHRLELTVADRAGREFPIEMALQVDDRPGGPLLHAFVHDISDRREARRRLEEERTFLRALLDSLQVGVMACDGDGRLTLFNRAARELHRVPGDPPGGSDGDWPQDRNLFAPDGRTPLRPEQAPLARARAGENVDGQHLVIRPPEAEPRRCVVNGRPITTPDGRRLGAVSALHDITDQHRAQVLRDAQHAVAQALAEAVCSEQAAARVLTAVTRALDWSYGEYWQIDPDRSALVRAGAWHRPGLAFTGDPTEAVRRGQGLPGRVWATGRTVWMSDLRTEPRPFPRRREALEAGLRSAIALPVRSGDQVLGVLVFCSEAVQEPDDDLVALLDGVCAHVGRFMERRRAEELALALAASRRHFDQVVSQLDDNVWTIEITPDGRARSVYQSQNAAGVFGGRVPEGADISGLLRRHVHPEDLPAYTAFDEKVNTGIPAQVECRVIGLDGAVRWIWIRSTPRREDGRLFADGISTDVTERHRLAEERDRMKDELVALVSHELRNPVGAIRGYVEMLVDTPGLTGTQRMFADVIDRTSAHLLDLVDDLLDLARLDAGHIAIDPRPVSLARLVRQAVDDHRAAAAARHLTVATDLAPHPPVHADPVRLRQVLDNLLSNAVKYTPDGGAVTVGLGGDDADRAAVVTVADTGIGVPAEEYPQLFGRFFRASTAQEAGIKGTGLGLAVTRAIVEAHGGTAAAAPRKGGGTVFTVRLPAASSPPGAHGRPHPAHR